MPKVIDKILRAGEGKILRQLTAIADQVNALEDEFRAMSDDELRGMTAEFRARLDKGQTIDDLMPEAFATVREAARRTLGQRHFDVQIMGGAALHLHPLPGHTRDCIVGFVPEWGVLLAGDTVETPLPVVNDGAAVRGWIERLDRWAVDPSVTTVVPAHGRVGGRELIDETASYLRGVLSAVAGGSPDAAAVDLSSALAFYAKTHTRNLQRVAGALGASKH